MKRYKAYKFKLLPNQKQAEYFDRAFGAVRFVFNKMLEERIEMEELYFDDPEIYRQHEFKTYTQIKHENPWLYEIDNQALANAKLNLTNAYVRFRDQPNNGYPKFKSKKRCMSYTTNNNTFGKIRIDGKYIQLPKIKWVKLIQHRELPADGRIFKCTVSKSATNKYYVSILIERDVEEIQYKVDKEKSIGLDMGLKTFYTDSQGVKVNSPIDYSYIDQKLSRVNRQISKCEVGSKNRDKLQLKANKLHEKLTNQRKDFLHKKARQIADEYDVACIEGLSVKEMGQHYGYGKMVQNNSWGVFVEILGHKLEERGKKLIKADKYYPSSQTCHKCGRINKDLKLKDRIWICPCGETLDRDINAAINIRNEGLRLLATS